MRYELGLIPQKTASFRVTDVKTSNLTDMFNIGFTLVSSSGYAATLERQETCVSITLSGIFS
jgi:hypothetical protein